MDFNTDAMKQQGFSDQDVNNFLDSTSPNPVNLDALRANNFSEGDIRSYLASQAVPQATDQQPIIQQPANKQAGSVPNLQDLLSKSAQKYGIDPRLMYATVMTESSGNPNAFRAEPTIGDASYGLGQLLYGTAKGLGYTGSPEGLYDPATNLDLTAHYIKNAIAAGAQSPQDVATYYNTGHLGGIPWPGHIQRFMSYYGGGN